MEIFTEEQTSTATAPEETYEESIARRYSELGVQISNLMDEREALKDNEIIPAMMDGCVFGFMDKALVFEYSELTKFDHKRARSDGAISNEVWKEYSSVEVSRKLIARKRDDKGKAALQQELVAVRDFLKGRK